MFRIATKLVFKPARIYCYRPYAYYLCRALTGSTALKMQSNPKCKTASSEATVEENIASTRKKQATSLKRWTTYSKVSMLEAEKRLGFRFMEFEKHGMPVSQMLAQAKPKIKGLGNDQVQKTKEMVFENIVQYLEGQGFPTEFNADFNEANVNDLVLVIILPILAHLKFESGRHLLLRREKDIIAAGSKIHGLEAFVGMDLTGAVGQNFVFIVEVVKSLVVQAKK